MKQQCERPNYLSPKPYMALKMIDFYKIIVYEKSSLNIKWTNTSVTSRNWSFLVDEPTNETFK